MNRPETGRRPDAPDDGVARLTSGMVAQRLGVSPTTLRSWDRRYGLGPARRNEGRHRRWSPEDIAVLETMCRLTAQGVPPGEAARLARSGAAPSDDEPPADPALDDASPDEASDPRLGPVRPECRGLGRAAVRLDTDAVEEHLHSFLRGHGVVAAWEELMMPTLHAVGRKWETGGDRYVEVEHFLSWHVSTALRTAPFLVPRPARRGGPPVLLACTPGEQHTLPLEAVHAALVGEGIPVRMLGAAVPADALLEAVQRTGPAAVTLWSQTRSSASAALADHLVRTGWGLKGARRRPVIQLAGPGWRGASVEGASYPHSLTDAVAALRGP
ncbi:MerR family transcriptional regulator [Streptomyces sp. VRA16 Mangrove soil]|uniref:MerR family transcriptional regulator n=1 Tax=Streptomyces sp. VRA16 Mangrove soil TaxID=2817434 RepID=UPI001A9F74E3|nr:MerR family transcriptional regulator [Streptomyces sp. VRA16 Mangrove soil]MBO1330389.1 MerR family transcriptional regulator [Streptomyces sp. VRA16 Mangrove soil]